MLTFMEAIAQMEGYNTPGTRPARNFNPGDIEYGPFAEAHGATGTDGRFAIFPDSATGYAAMRALLTEPAKWLWEDTAYQDQPVPGRKLEEGYLGATLWEVLNKWAPPVENNVSAYLHGVCEMTSLTPETVLTLELLT